MNDLKILEPHLDGTMEDMSRLQKKRLELMSARKFAAILSFVKNQRAEDQAFSWKLLSSGDIIGFVNKFHDSGAEALINFDGVYMVHIRSNKAFWDELNKKERQHRSAGFGPRAVVPTSGWSKFRSSTKACRVGKNHKKPGHA